MEFEAAKEAVEKANRIVIIGHLNPDADALGTGLGLYWVPRGVGKRVEIVNATHPLPQKLDFLPEPWTDFIAAVIAEELGLVAMLGLIGLYALFLWRGLYIARHARDSFSMLLASTLTLMVALEAFFNLKSVMCPSNKKPSEDIHLDTKQNTKKDKNW
jgi:cell division protein FtsW (lipid II flippase)